MAGADSWHGLCTTFGILKTTKTSAAGKLSNGFIWDWLGISRGLGSCKVARLNFRNKICVALQ